MVFLPPDPIPPLMAAQFTSADAGYALGIPNYPDFRRNFERQSEGSPPLANLLRADGSTTYRIGHIYEQALFSCLSKSTDRKTASEFIRAYFSRMTIHASNIRYHQLPVEDQKAIADYYKGQDKSEIGKFPWLVDFPWLGFDQDVLDRSPERQVKPVLWIMAGDIDGKADNKYRRVHPAMGVAYDTFPTEEGARLPGSGYPSYPRNADEDGNVSVSDIYEGLEEEIAQTYPQLAEDGDYLAKNPVIILNVTRILTEVDRKLTTRLRIRKLRGE